jgi:hypothetical protein
MGASAQAAPTETRSDENTLRAVVRAGLEAAAWQRHGRGGAGKPAVAQHLQTVPEQQANFLQVLIGRSVFLRKSPTRQLATGRTSAALSDAIWTLPAAIKMLGQQIVQRT